MRIFLQGGDGRLISSESWEELRCVEVDMVNILVKTSTEERILRLFYYICSMKRLIIILMCCFGASTLQAQEATLTTPDAKALGMGGLVMTAESASHAIYNNSAIAAFTRTPFLVSSSYFRQGDNDSYAVTGLCRFGNGNVLQGGWRQYLRDNDSNDTAVDLGYSRRINERLGIGIVARYMHQKRPEITTNALAVDLSAAYKIPLEHLGVYSEVRTGAKLSNLGAYLSDTDYTLPMNASVGAALDSYITDEHEITIGVDMGYYFYPKPVRGFECSVGAEYNLMQLIQVRGGYHYGEKGSYFPSYSTVGVGLRILHIRLDFAYLFAEKGTAFRNTYSLSFGLDF